MISCDPYLNRTYHGELLWYESAMKSHMPSNLSDTELAAEVKRLAGCERETTAALISHLAEFDARRLY